MVELVKHQQVVAEVPIHRTVLELLQAASEAMEEQQRAAVAVVTHQAQTEAIMALAQERASVSVRGKEVQVAKGAAVVARTREVMAAAVVVMRRAQVPMVVLETTEAMVELVDLVALLAAAAAVAGVGLAAIRILGVEVVAVAREVLAGLAAALIQERTASAAPVVETRATMALLSSRFLSHLVFQLQAVLIPRQVVTTSGRSHHQALGLLRSVERAKETSSLSCDMAKASQATDIAVLTRDVAEIKGTLAKIDGRMELFDKEYIKRAEVEAFRSADGKVEDNLQSQITELRNLMSTETVQNAVFRSQIKTWGVVGSIALGVVSPVLVGTVLHFIFT